MAVPAHDERDREFAETFDLPIVEVITEDGALVNSRRVRRPAGRGGEEGDRREAARRGQGRAGRLATACATGASAASATGAARSRSSTATTCGEVARPRRPAAGRAARGRGLPAEGRCRRSRSNKEWLHVDLPEVRRPGHARGRHDGHLRRLVLVLPALRRPAQRRGAVRPAAGRLLVPDHALHRRDRPRDRPPALLALLRQGDERAGDARLPRAVRAPLPPGLGDDGRDEDVEVEGQRHRARRGRRRRTAPTRCASTSSSWAPPTRTWSGRRPGSRGWRGSSAGCGASSTRSPQRARRRPAATARSSRKAHADDRSASPTTSTAAAVPHADLGGDGARQRDRRRPRRSRRALRRGDRGVAAAAVGAARHRGAVGRARHTSGCGSSRGPRPTRRCSSSETSSSSSR